jgi:hypothetical protein
VQSNAHVEVKKGDDAEKQIHSSPDHCCFYPLGDIQEQKTYLWKKDMSLCPEGDFLLNEFIHLYPFKLSVVINWKEEDETQF